MRQGSCMGEEKIRVVVTQFAKEAEKNSFPKSYVSYRKPRAVSTNQS